MTKLDRAGIVEEIENASDKVENMTGTRPKLFRAPSGAYNDLLVETARGLGYEVIQWDCDFICIKQNMWPDESRQQRWRKKAGPGRLPSSTRGQSIRQSLCRSQDRKKEMILPVSEMIYWDNYEMDVQGRQHPLPKAPDSGEILRFEPEGEKLVESHVKF